MAAASLIAAARPRRIGRPGARIALLAGAVLSTVVLAPIAAVLVRLAATAHLAAAVAQIMTSPVYQGALFRTGLIGVTAAASSTLLATFFALLTHRTDLQLRRLISALIVIPYFIPLLVTALAWTLLSAEESGLINRGLRALGANLVLDVYSVPGIIFVLAVGLLPIAFFFVAEAVAHPASEQEEAALVAGASPLRVILLVTLPRILPTLGATFLIILVLAAANFSVPAVLGLSSRIDVLSTQIYVAMNNYPVSYPRVAVVALTLVVLLAGLLAIQQRLERRARASSQQVSRTEPIVWALGRWRWPCLILIGLYFCVALLLPLGAIVVTSLLPFVGAPLNSFTTESFGRVLDSDAFQSSIVNTVIFAVVGATISVSVGTLAAYLFRRLRPPGAAVWDAIISAPLALPGIVIGLGYLWIAVGSPVYGTLTLTTAVVIVRFVPFALRSGSAALTRVDPSLDEASRIAGAGEAQVLFRIVLPNLRRSVLSMWGMLFVLFTHEVDTNVLLQGTDNRVLSVQIYDWYQYGGLDLASAGAVALLLMTAIVLGAVAVVVRSGRRGPLRMGP